MFKPRQVSKICLSSSPFAPLLSPVATICKSPAMPSILPLHIIHISISMLSSGNGCSAVFFVADEGVEQGEGEKCKPFLALFSALCLSIVRFSNQKRADFVYMAHLIVCASWRQSRRRRMGLHYDRREEKDSAAICSVLLFLFSFFPFSSSRAAKP